MTSVYRGFVNRDNMAWFNGGPFRPLKVVGPDAFGISEDFVGTDVAANVLPGWTCTLVNSSTVTLSTASGGGLILTTDSAENDGVNAQMDGEAFEFTSGQALTYFGVKFQASEATQSDFLVGMTVTDTDALGGVTDGVYFIKVDGSTDIKLATEKDSTATTSDALGTFAASTDTTLEFYWDGSTVHALVDGVVKTTQSTNIPDNEALTPTIHFLTGDDSAETMTVDWVRAFQVGR